MQAYRRLITERRYEGDMVHCLTPESSTYPPGKERMMPGLCGVILRILSSKKHCPVTPQKCFGFYFWATRVAGAEKALRVRELLHISEGNPPKPTTNLPILFGIVCATVGFSCGILEP